MDDAIQIMKVEKLQAKVFGDRQALGRAAGEAVAARLKELLPKKPVSMIFAAAPSQNEFLELTLDWLYAHVRRLWVSEPDRLVSLRAAIEDHAVIADAI